MSAFPEKLVEVNVPVEGLYCKPLFELFIFIFSLPILLVKHIYLLLFVVSCIILTSEAVSAFPETVPVNDPEKAVALNVPVEGLYIRFV